MPTRIVPVPGIGIAGVEVWRVEREGGRSGSDGISIEIAPTPASWPGGVREAVEKRWAAMVAENPRLYSGPLLSVTSIDFELGVVHAVRDEFKRLAVQPQVRTGVQIMSVTGAITARGMDGRERVLLGRRGRTTRIYGGMWELGPAGGVTPPHGSVGRLEEEAAIVQVVEEGEEELGLKLSRGAIGAVRLIVRDTVACSDDLTFWVRHEERGSFERLSAEMERSRATQAWEYEETAWVGLEDLARFDVQHAGEIIITSRAVFRALGWMG